MKRLALTVLCSISLASLAGCGAAGDDPSATETFASETVAQPAADAADAAASGEMAPLAGRPGLELSLPKMAYVFDYGFRLAGEAIAPLQQTHADMCEAQGPYACQIISLSRSGEDTDQVTGELQLAVAADRAREFAGRLTQTATGAGAESIRADISGEDLSKSIVDTEARVRTRIALRDRLLEVLRTRKGTVQELVEAERGVAQVNEEIDQAQSWLKEQNGRVAYSRLTLSYESANPGGNFLGPIKDAFGAVGAIAGTTIGFLIMILAVTGPLLAGALGVRWLRRRFGSTPIEA